MNPSSRTRPANTVARVVLAAVIGAGVLLSVALTAASQPAGAAPATGSTVTYSATETIPAPPPSNFAGSAGGDGWGLAMSPTAVYNVFHHQPTLQVACHLQSNASACWSPKTITDGSGHNFAESGQPGLWLNAATGKLYVFGNRTSDSTAGVVCIDTTKPAGDADPFCGFTPLSAVGDAPLNPDGTSGISDPVIVGTSWYAFNAVAGTPSGTEDKLMCFSLTSLSACGGQPYAVNIGAGTVTNIAFPSPSIAAINGQIVIPINMSTGDRLACVNAATVGACAGSWPVDTTSLNYPLASNVSTGGGAPFPLLNTSGATTGFCIPIVNDPCFSLTGSSVSTPAGMATAVGATYGWNGPSLVLGARIYVPNGSTGGNLEAVDCYDYSKGAGCANFPKSFNNLSLLYTVNADPQRPTCIWVNSDGGADQIQNFDAYTGGACGQGAIRVLASSIVAPNNICIPSNYTSLQVLTPPRNGYSSGSVQFEDFDGNPIAGIPPQTLDASGSANLAPLNLTTKSPLPQFLITLNNAGAPAEVEVKLTWTGTYSPSCTEGGQTVGNEGYRLGASDGGVFAFGQDAFYGSMGGQPLNGPEVGIAATPDNAGYWLVASDGGIFSFGDAVFYGSMGGQPLDKPIVGMASTPDGKGYWLVASDGGIFTFGDAAFEGSLGGQTISAPIVGIAPTPDGKGYWLAGADGAVYALGDASYKGSEAGQFLNGPIVGIAAHGSGGYWLVASDGGVFAFGDAPFFGSMYGKHLNGPEIGMVPTSDGNGYWLAAADGGVFAFGDAEFFGSMALTPLNAPIVSLTS